MGTEILAAVQRSNQAYYDLISEQETLGCGIAAYSTAYPLLAEANHLREVLVPDPQRIADHWAQVEEFYESRGLRCLRWMPSIEQSPDAIAPFLNRHGFVQEEMLAMTLKHWPTLTRPESVRIVQARPLRAKLAETYADQAPDGDEARANMLAEAGLARLDDSRLDMFVALLDGLPAGRGALFSVGDIGRVIDVYVCRAHRGKGIGIALCDHIVKLARRLAFRTHCLEIPANDKPALALCRRAGFMEAGRTIRFARPISSSCSPTPGA